MATRSRIGIELESGEVKSIYCHFDGYESGVGATLKEHYTDRGKIEALIALGDISVLGEDEYLTIAYHRDRGEDFEQARTDKSVEAYSKSDIEEYGYVFTRDGNWLCFKDY